MAARHGTRDGERLDVLVTLLEAYERKHFPMDLPDPIEAIRFSMEQKRLTARDLVPMIGQINRVCEVLNGKRPLTLQMIRRLHREFGGTGGIPDRGNRGTAGCLKSEPSVLFYFLWPSATCNG